MVSDFGEAHPTSATRGDFCRRRGAFFSLCPPNVSFVASLFWRLCCLFGCAVCACDPLCSFVFF